MFLPPTHSIRFQPRVIFRVKGNAETLCEIFICVCRQPSAPFCSVRIFWCVLFSAWCECDYSSIYFCSEKRGARTAEYDILCWDLETLRRRCAWSFSIFICAAERRAPSEKVNSAFIFHTWHQEKFYHLLMRLASLFTCRNASNHLSSFLVLFEICCSTNKVLYDL
jgi:hypothetical protein